MSAQPHYLHQTDKSLLTLESVILDFLNWRRDPHRKSRIPESLWDKVISLLSQHAKSKVLSRLGISGAQLTQKLKERGIFTASVQSALPMQTTTETASFIKAVISASIPENVFDVVLTKPNGITLQIKKLSLFDISKLTEQFTG